jgi:hypothetical protein
MPESISHHYILVYNQPIISYPQLMKNENTIEKRKFTPGVYRHFKGGMYLALMLAKDSETEEDTVVYIPLYYKEESETRAWVRSLDNFMGTKELEDGTEVNRFEFVSER